jgi:ubiquinone/menaquinone biosynthesis C-methylase UbiE
MRYIPSKELQAENLNYDSIEGNFAWPIKDGTYARLRERYNLGTVQTMLDIGCGSGAALREMQGEDSIELHGVDINDYRSEENKQHISFSARDLNFDSLPYDDASFDIVTCYQTIEHLENPFLVMREIARVLKPNGYFIWSVPNPFQLTFRMKYLFTGDMPPWVTTNDHLLFMTRAVMEKTYLAHFSLIETIYQVGTVPFWGRLRKIFGKRLIKKHLFIMPRNETFGRRVCYVMRSKD